MNGHMRFPPTPMAGGGAAGGFGSPQHQQQPTPPPPAASVAPMNYQSPTPPPMRPPAAQAQVPPFNNSSGSLPAFGQQQHQPVPPRVPPIGVSSSGQASAFGKPVGATAPMNTMTNNSSYAVNNGYPSPPSNSVAAAGGGRFPPQPSMAMPPAPTANQNQFAPSPPPLAAASQPYPPSSLAAGPSTAPGLSGPPMAGSRPPLVPSSNASSFNYTSPTAQQQTTFPPMPPAAAAGPPGPGGRPPPVLPPMPNNIANNNNGAMANGPPRGMPPMPTYNGQQQQPQAGLHTQQVPVDPNRPLDLMQERDILHAGSASLDPPPFNLPHIVENPRCRVDPNVFRSTLNAVPQSKDVLQKSRLPFGLILHPFRDMKAKDKDQLQSLNVINTQVIVRCRSCRTYINPFVSITDPRHWKCNMCFRTNDLPDEFNWDPVTKAYGEPQRRPEIKFATVEFIAPSEYMPVRKNAQNRNELRAAQAALYCFILDVSQTAIETGYLHTFAAQLSAALDKLPGDDRLQVAFIAVDSCIRFYQFTAADQPPTELVLPDVDDVFLPANEGLVVNLRQCRAAVADFVEQLPDLFPAGSTSPHNALGAAVSIAHTMIQANGGRVTVLQCSLPDVGPGALQSREDPNNRASNEVTHLTPATDFYKSLALECNGHQVAIDLFMMNTKYADLATLSEMSRFSGGVVHHFPNLHFARNGLELKRFDNTLRRYLTRKIGFEAVLRIRCTRGLTLKQFYGNFFVRSTDLLALPNVNPDSVMGVQVDYEDNLADNVQCACFQAALLYTSSKGDRRIRVHTLCLPVVNKVPPLFDKLDVHAMMSMLAKFAVERSVQGGSVQDARDALVNSCVDALGAYAHSLPVSLGAQALLAPQSMLRTLPWYTAGMLKSQALVAGQSVKLDVRVGVMCDMRCQPTETLVLSFCPALYPLHTLADQDSIDRLPLSYASIEQTGVYLLDVGLFLYIYVCQAVPDSVCAQLFGAQRFHDIEEDVLSLHEQPDSVLNDRVHQFIQELNTERCFIAPLTVIREDSPKRELFVRRLIEDKTEASHSYVEFLQYIRKSVPAKNR